MGADSYDALKQHLGHKIVIVAYGKFSDPDNIAIECETCNEVLADYDAPDLNKLLTENDGDINVAVG